MITFVVARTESPAATVTLAAADLFDAPLRITSVVPSAFVRVFQSTPTNFMAGDKPDTFRAHAHT